MTTVYNLCKLLIDRGRTDGLQDKMDVYLAADRLTPEEYQELAGLLAYRYGKWAMLLYGLVIFVICLFAGGVFGIFAASSQVEDNLAARLLQWAAGLPAAGIAGLAVAGSAVLAAVTWIFFRRTAVKS